jgi:hypothetical protein
MSVADNARFVVLLHVSASSERQERRNETGAMTQTTERHIITHSDVCGSSVLWFCTVVHLVVKGTLCMTQHTLQHCNIAIT